MTFPVTLKPVFQLASRTGVKWAKALSILLVLLAGLSFCATRANADSITLLSTHESGGLTFYLYDIVTTEATTWSVGEAIDFSGISMLTGFGEAGIPLAGFGLGGLESTGTVEFTDDIPISLAAGTTTGILEFDSSSTTMGLVHYVSTSDPAFSGTVEGPVGTAGVPEPSSILLLGIGLSSLLGMTLLSKRLA
jgi:PEP-CTERM motif